MIVTSTEAQILGYSITAYKGIVHGLSWAEILRNAEAMGANAILNTCFDDALDVDTLFHGSAVVLRRNQTRGSTHRGSERRELLKPAWSNQ